MASSPCKALAVLLLCLVALPQCSDFRAVFNGKPGKPVAETKRKKKKHPSGYARGKGAGMFIWPFDGPVNSPYGERNGRPHDGIDIGGDEGDPIVASAAGEVVYEGKLGGYGNLIVVKHDSGYFTAYAHNDKNLVDTGDRVKQGQRIAKMGSTGNASGDHLHFEVRDDSGTYDPEDFLPEPQYSSK